MVNNYFTFSFIYLFLKSAMDMKCLLSIGYLSSPIHSWLNKCSQSANMFVWKKDF